MKTVTMMLAASLALAACSNEERAPAPAESAQPAPTGRDAVYAAAEQGPEAFVRALYAQYEAGGPQGEPPAPGRDPIYERRLNAMIGADVMKAAGEVPTLNYDPICACQDKGEFRLTSVAVAQSGPNDAVAEVAFTNMGEAQQRTLTLKREGPMWKVADVQAPGEEKLTETLLKAIG